MSDADERSWLRANKAYAGGGLKARPSAVRPDRSREVVMHVAGRIYGWAGLKSHLDYLTRDGTVPGETQSGKLIEGEGKVAALHRDWMLAQHVYSDPKRRHDASHAVHMVISMPEGTDREAAHDAARAWARAHLRSYDWMIVQHTDIERPHSHISIRSVGRDNRRFHMTTAQLTEWREGLAREMQARGIEATATRWKPEAEPERGDRYLEPGRA